MANVLYDSIDPDLLKPALVADLRRGGLFPPAGEKISFADDPLVAQEH